MEEFELNHTIKEYTDKTGEDILVERMTITCESGDLSEVINSVNFFINKEIRRQIEEQGLPDFKCEVKYSRETLLDRYDYEIYQVSEHWFQHTFTPKPLLIQTGNYCKATMCESFATHICDSCGRKICDRCSKLASWARGCCSKKQAREAYERTVSDGALHSALLEDEE